MTTTNSSWSENDHLDFGEPMFFKSLDLVHRSVDVSALVELGKDIKAQIGKSQTDFLKENKVSKAQLNTVIRLYLDSDSNKPIHTWQFSRYHATQKPLHNLISTGIRYSDKDRDQTRLEVYNSHGSLHNSEIAIDALICKIHGGDPFKKQHLITDLVQRFYYNILVWEIAKRHRDQDLAKEALTQVGRSGRQVLESSQKSCFYKVKKACDGLEEVFWNVRYQLTCVFADVHQDTIKEDGIDFAGLEDDELEAKRDETHARVERALREAGVIEGEEWDEETVVSWKDDIWSYILDPGYHPEAE